MNSVTDTKFIIHLIGRIHEKANRFLAAELNNYNIEGIAPSHGDILGALCLREPLQMKELARIINRDKSTVTALVNKLVALGFIEKHKDFNDNRVTFIRLTEKGKAIRSNILEIGRKMQKQAYRNLSEGEKIILVELLEKIDHNF